MFQIMLQIGSEGISEGSSNDIIAFMNEGFPYYSQTLNLYGIAAWGTTINLKYISRNALSEIIQINEDCTVCDRNLSTGSKITSTKVVGDSFQYEIGHAYVFEPN